MLPPPPTDRNLPVIQHLIKVYKLWHEFLPHIAKAYRYTIGAKIDNLFVEILELIFIAMYTNKKERALFVRKAITKLDLLKFFFEIIWEFKAIDNKKYVLLSEPLQDIGKMLGGWLRQLLKETPPN